MRALILGLSALVVGLVVSIIYEVTGRARSARQVGAEFSVARLIADALPGEMAAYREAGGRARRRTFVVESVVSPDSTPAGVPVVNLRQRTVDPRLPPDRADEVRYGHRVTDHFWFPLTQPRAPEAKDRVWILQRIRQATLLLAGRERPCWRIDLIDPALPKPSEHVVAWLDPEVPVFGLLKWTRADETWVLESSREAP